MASIPSTTLLISSLVISFFLFAYPASSGIDPKTQELIDQVCRQMEDYGFCDKTFIARLRSPLTDLVGLAQIAVEATTENATNNFAFIKGMVDNSTDANAKKALTECATDYQGIMGAFVEAMRLFALGDYKGMLNREMPTSKALGLCQEGLPPGFPVNPYFFLIERNRQQRILIAMSVVTAHLLVS